MSPLHRQSGVGMSLFSKIEFLVTRESPILCLSGVPVRLIVLRYPLISGVPVRLIVLSYPLISGVPVRLIAFEIPINKWSTCALNSFEIARSGVHVRLIVLR